MGVPVIEYCNPMPPLPETPIEADPPTDPDPPPPPVAKGLLTPEPDPPLFPCPEVPWPTVISEPLLGALAPPPEPPF